MNLIEWIKRPYIKIRLKDVTGLDGVTRKCYYWFGIIWGTEYHTKHGEKLFGYYELYYDGPIHNFGLGFCELFWHIGVE